MSRTRTFRTATAANTHALPVLSKKISYNIYCICLENKSQVVLFIHLFSSFFDHEHHTYFDSLMLQLFGILTGIATLVIFHLAPRSWRGEDK